MTGSNAAESRQLTLLAFLCVLVGCLESGAAPDEGEDPVEVAIAALGVAIPGCDNGGFSGNTLTLTVSTDALILSAKGGKIQANGYICRGMVGNKLQQLTPNDVYKIVVLGDGASNKVILDLQPVTFGMRIFSNQGGITVDFATTSGGNDVFGIRGGNSAETFKFGKSKTTSDIYAELTRDKVADLRIRPGTDLALIASSGNGADTMTGSATGSDMTSFGGSSISVEPISTGISLYGGLGNDTLTGGGGDDFVSGGLGNDTLKASAHPDGNDVFSGGDGSDTVDYSVRAAALTIDIGPVNVARVARADLGKLDYAQLAGKTLVFAIDGAGDQTVTFGAPLTPADVIAAINGVAGAEVATITGKNQLMIMSTTHLTTSSVKVDESSTAIAAGILDMPAGTSTTMPGTAIPIDNDDGQSGETDDVRSGTENIIGGLGSDTLVGDHLKNTIKGGGGHDQLAGGSNPCAPGLTLANGDVLQGEAGNDTFYVPAPNCWAVLSGGPGNNTADFSGRSVPVSLSNNGVANDGIADERINVATDISTLIGGMGGDTFTGGTGSDTFVGGRGADVFNGGGGTDIVDYSAVTADTTISLCFTSTIAGCGAGDDGPAEGDQLYMVEHVIGGSGADTMNVFGDAAVSVTFEGRAGGDILTGGAGNDTIRGEDDDDTILGGDGDDTLVGGAGVDVIDGGEGDGDLCGTDGSDAPPAVNCEG